MSEPLRYTPPGVGLDSCSYDVTHVHSFSEDSVSQNSLVDLLRLATSDSWEDRIRAEVLHRRLSITLPPGFPCIYETPDSPNNAGVLHPSPKPWVVSPDMGMLEKLLPLYQELWDSYTAQWGHRSRRLFAVGLLDDLPVGRVYRPGTTPGQVIGDTMRIHSMYRTAPEHLRRHHPLHATWHPESPTKIP